MQGSDPSVDIHALRRIGAALLCAGVCGSVCAAPYAAMLPAPVAPSADAAAAVRFIESSADTRGAPFLIVDKREARVWVYTLKQGRAVLSGSSPILLGLAHGDDSVPGIGERPMEQIKPNERTTPAGRFVIEPGVNADGEDILWIDYDAAVSMHRVRANNPRERRLQRLATPSAADNRISYGCINVPARFYDATIRPTFVHTSGIAYVLPESRPLQSLWDAARPAVNATVARDAAPTRSRAAVD